MARPAPTTPYDRALQTLLDRTLCPACATPLPGTRCPACGLDVTAPGAGLVWQESVAAADALRRRAEHVAAMRAATARAVAAVATPPARPVGSGGGPAPAVPGAVVRPQATPPAAVLPPAMPGPVGPSAGVPRPAGPAAGVAPGAVAVPVPVGATAPVPVGPGVPSGRPWTSPGAPEAPVRAPWRVQTVLQVVGAALLVAACVTFLVFAWDVLTLGARAAAVGTATVVVFALAAVLRSRGLPQGAEAVGALAAALLLLDAWALRATGAVVVGDGPGQATASLLLAAALLAAWGRAARVRAGTVTAAALLPLLPLVWLPRAGGAEGASALLAGAAALTLVRAAAGPGRGAERRVLQVAAWGTAAPAVVVAAVAVLARTLLGGAAWSAAGVLAATAVVLALQARTDARAGTAAATRPVTEGVAQAPAPGSPAAPPGTARPRATGAAWWSTSGLTTALAAAAAGGSAARTAGADGATTWHVAALAAVGAGLVLPLLLPLLAARATAPRPFTSALRTAAGAAAGATAAWLALASLARLLAPGATRPVAVVAALSAVVALAAACVLAGRAAAGRAGTGARALGRAQAVAAVLASVAGPVLLADHLAVGGGVRSAVTVAALAAVAAGWVVVGRVAPDRRTTGAAGEASAAATAVLAAAPSPAAAAAALLLAAVVAVHARTWSPRPSAGAASTATAAILAAAAGAAVAVALGLPAAAGAAVATALATAGLVARAARPTAAAPERRAALVTAAPLVLVVWSATAWSVSGPGAWTLVAPALAAASGLVLVAALLRDVAGAGRASVVAGAAAAAPVAALAVVTLHAALGRPVPVGAALLSVALGAASTLAAHLVPERGGRAARVAAEVAGWSVLACGVLASAAVGPAATVAALAAGAATATGWSLRRDRRPAWWLAWGLGTTAWAVALAATGTEPVEPYLVPPGLALVAVGALRLRRGTPDATPLVAGGAALVCLPTALLPAVLPLGDRWADRAAVTVVLAAATLVAAALLARGPHGPDAEPRRAAAALAALAGVLAVLGPARRAVLVATGGTPAPGPLADAVEPWALPAAALLAATALVARRTWRPDRAAVVTVVAPWLVLAVGAVPVLLAVALATTGPGLDDRLRLVVLGLLGVAATAASAARERRAAASSTAGARAPRLADLGLALAAAVALVAPAVLPVALADAPAGAVALLAAGAAALAARRSGSAPVAWVALVPLALVPTVAVRVGTLRPVAWVLVAALLLALALAARGTGTRAADEGPAAQAARVPGRTRARAVALTLAASSAVLVLLGPWADAVADALGAAAPSLLAVELPALAAAAAVGVAWALVRSGASGTTHRPADATTTPRRSAPVPGSAALALATLAVPVLLAVDGTALGAARAAAVLTAAGVLAWSGRGAGDEAWGTVVVVAAALAAALRDGAEPAEVPVVVAGLLTVALGARRLARTEHAGSWSSLGAPLAVTLGVPVVALLALPTPARAVTALLLALAATVVGAVRRLQAPLLLGAVASLVSAGTLLTPVAAETLARVDGWVLLGVGGAAVLGLGLTYERRVREAREAVRVVAAMR